MAVRKSRQRMKRIAQGLFLTIIALLFLPQDLMAETIGVIIPGNIQYYREVHNSFLARLKKEGFSERVEVILQKPHPDYISMSNAARKLSALDVDLIITYGAPPTVALLDLKTKIPTVYSCLSESFAQKVRGRNITGVSYRLFPSSLIRYIKEIVPVKTIGIIYSLNDPDSIMQMEEIRKASEQYGFKAELITLDTARDVRRILSIRDIDAIFITQTPVAELALPQIIQYARLRRIPTASLLPGDAGHHPTIALYIRQKELGEKIAEIAIGIMDGLSPERIKVSCCNEVELVFNLREVKEMGYKIPMDLVATATRLIQ